MYFSQAQQMKNSWTRFPSSFLKTFTLRLKIIRPKQIRLRKGRKFKVGGETPFWLGNALLTLQKHFNSLSYFKLNFLILAKNPLNIHLWDTVLPYFHFLPQIKFYDRFYICNILFPLLYSFASHSKKKNNLKIPRKLMS